MDRLKCRSSPDNRPQKSSPTIGILSIRQAVIALLILCLIVFSVVQSMQASSWVPGLEMLSWIAFAGIAVGVLLATLKGHVILVHFVGLGSGAFLISFCVSSLIEGALWRDRLSILWVRLASWLQITLEGGMVTDYLLFLLSMAAIVWILGYVGAWTVFRLGTAWWAILGAGIIVLINVSFVHDLSFYAIVYWIGAIALTSLMHSVKRERDWRNNNIYYTSGLGGQVFQWGLVVGLIVVIASWALPSVIVNDQLSQLVDAVNGPWRRVEGEVTKIFGSIGFSGSAGSPGGNGSVLVLKGSVRLGDEPILDIASTESFYLKGSIYEQYTGHGWISAKANSYEVPANDESLSGGGDYLLRRNATYAIQLLAQRGQTVYVAGEPKTVNIPVIADLDMTTEALQQCPSSLTSSVSSYSMSSSQVSLPGTFLEPRGVTSIRALPPMNIGFRYLVSSSISTAEPSILRRAGTDYPEWVKNRFLALPSTVPKRVLALAQMVTKSEDNPYDKASAIESYLRQYPYTLDLPSPPPDQDAVSYFLFDARKGYCDYYASAMGVMLRAVGIPSRIVSGYAPGAYNTSTGHYVVTGAQAHTWVEAYFPGLGWIEFEPTSSHSVVSRPPGQSLAADSPLGASVNVNIPSLEASLRELNGRTNSSASEGWGHIWQLAQGLMPWVGFAFLAGAALFTFLRSIWLRGLIGLPLSQSLYVKMCRLSQWMGVRKDTHETPHEYANRLSLLVPDASDSIGQITNSYVHAVFGHRPPVNEVRRDLTQAWRKIRGCFMASAVMLRVKGRRGVQRRK